MKLDESQSTKDIQRDFFQIHLLVLQNHKFIITTDDLDCALKAVKNNDLDKVDDDEEGPDLGAPQSWTRL